MGVMAKPSTLAAKTPQRGSLCGFTICDLNADANPGEDASELAGRETGVTQNWNQRSGWVP
jgi:hypothetical protein